MSHVKQEVLRENACAERAALAVISNQVVHSESLGKNGRYHTFRSIREEAPSECSS